MWDTDGDRLSEHLRLRWRERGVMIERDPVKRGYGSEILERSIPGMLDGSLDRPFHPDGVECVFEFAIES